MLSLERPGSDDNIGDEGAGEHDVAIDPTMGHVLGNGFGRGKVKCEHGIAHSERHGKAL